MSYFDAFNDSLSSGNHMSPFGEAGLLFDPLAQIGGDKYRNFMRKTWEYPNEYLGKALKKHDEYDRKINPLHKAMDKTEIGGKIKEMVHNKPGDSALAVLGTIFGGGALMGGGASGGGMFGNMFGGGGAQSPNLGVFSNGGQGGMAGVGQGNAGQLFANTGINTGGVGGVGGVGQGMGGFANVSPQTWMQAGQALPGMQPQQQQQNTGPKPYLWKGKVVWM